MRWLLFLARVAFICNVFFVFCLLLRHTHLTIPAAFNEFVIIVGWVLSVVLNIVLHLMKIVLLATKKNVAIPLWINLFNLFIFFFQIVYFTLT